MQFHRGDQVAVNIEGIKLPLYGEVVSVDRRAKKITCKVFSKYGTRTMIVDEAIVAPWHRL